MSAVLTHLHGCVSCRDVFMDACDGRDNATCVSCRGNQDPPPWQVSRRPKDCCRLAARPASAEDCKKYRLASGNWWICPDCRRVQPFNPNTRSSS